VVAVLDAPVRPNRVPEARGIEPDLADVVRHLAPGVPQAGAGVLAPAQTRDARRTGDQALPCGRKPVSEREDLDAAVLLAAMAGAVHRHMPVNRVLLGTQPNHRLMQAGLVGLEPNQQRVAGACRRREAFFDHAVRRR